MAESSAEIVAESPIKKALSAPDVKKRFEEILGKRTGAFISSILSVVNSNQALKDCDPRTVLSAAAIAATLDLPINQNLGFAHIVPYSGAAQFQMGWKGFVQLAIRSGKYETMNASEVYADELKFWDPITGEIEFHPRDLWKQRYIGTGKVIGYSSYFKLTTGFKKFLYMTVEEIKAHGKKYSKSYSNPRSQWQMNFEAMALKTVMKLILSKWGILSIEMEKAIQADQAVVIDAEGQEFQYPDRPLDSEIPSKPTNSDKLINEDQLKLLCARADAEGIGESDVKKYIQKKFGKDHRKDITVSELSDVINWIKTANEPPAQAVGA